MTKKLLLVGALVLTLSGCASSAPNSAQACEQYFAASDQVEAVVDNWFDDLDTLTEEQRLRLDETYTTAINDQADRALLLSLAMTSEGLTTGPFAQDVQDLVALLSEQVMMLDYGGSDVTSLLRIQRLETQIRDQCKEIGGNL